MLFQNSYRRGLKIRNEARETTTSLQTVANWLNLPADELDIRGSRSLKEITVYTCIKILSEAVGKLPIKAYQDQGGKRKASEHYLYPLLKLRPNPYMSAMDFWKCLEVQRNIWGNAFAWLDVPRVGRNAGKIIGIYPLFSPQMTIWVDDVGLLSSVNSVWYVYTDNAGIQHKLTANDLLHFKGLSINGIAGLSTIETLRNTIENAKASANFLNTSYKKGMQVSGLVHYVGDLGPKEQETFKNGFETMSSGLANANRIALMPIGYQFQPIQLTLTDAQFVENTKLTIQQLTAAFGIKLHQVNYLEKASYASTSEANREFYVDTLMAILTMYEQELTYKLFTDPELADGYYLKFNADAILRGDFDARMNGYTKAVQAGIKTPNECRNLEEDEPKPGGDDLLVNGALKRLIDLPLNTKGGKNNNGQSA